MDMPRPADSEKAALNAMLGQRVREPHRGVERHDLVSLAVDEEGRGAVVAVEELQHGADGGDALWVDGGVFGPGQLGGEAGEAVEH